jgi:hypothetical protein
VHCALITFALSRDRNHNRTPIATTTTTHTYPPSSTPHTHAITRARCSPLTAVASMQSGLVHTRATTGRMWSTKDAAVWGMAWSAWMTRASSVLMAMVFSFGLLTEDEFIIIPSSEARA